MQSKTHRLDGLQVFGELYLLVELEIEVHSTPKQQGHPHPTFCFFFHQRKFE